MGSLYFTGAYAYTVNNNLSAYGFVVQTSGGYALMGGDDVVVGTSGPWPALDGQTIHIAQEQADAGDGQGSWGVMLGDMQGVSADNGYLLIADPSKSSNVQDWVNRLGGNLDYVLNYLQTQNQQIQVQNKTNYTSYTYVPFASVVNESGALIGSHTVSGPIGTYTDQSTGQTYQEYLYTYPIQPSAPPTANSVSVVDANTNQSGTVKQGDPMNFTVSSNVPLWNSLATHHWVSIQAVNQSNGQSVWLVGSGNTDKQQMQAESGSQDSFTDQFSLISSAALQPGTYTINAWVCDGVDRVSNAVTTTLIVQPGVGLLLSANPTSLPTGQASTLTATATNAPSGDYIKILDQSGANTLAGQNAYVDNRAGEQQLTTQAVSSTAQTVTYQAQLINAATGNVDATSNTVTVQWNAIKETITLTANPTLVQSGQPSTVSYTTTNMQPGDKVMLAGVGVNPPFQTISTLPSGSYIQVQNPTDGQSITVYYSANIVNSAGQIVAQSNQVAVTWKSLPPTISLTADPALMVPGQPSTIAYAVQGEMGPGDTISVSGTGNAANPWNTKNQTAYYESYQEVEHPASGQTISETYTAQIINSSGQVISQASVTVKWVNEWTGTINLSANPLHLPVQNPTTLTATTTQAIPAGYTLYIMDETTGQMVDSTGSTPFNTKYSSYNPETDTFIAYISDGYEQVGTPSNEVTVQWSQLALSANPTQLPAGQTTTLTVLGQNVPSGYYLVIYDQNTGQEIGYSQNTPYSVQVTRVTPETDTFIAYISSNTDQSGAFITSNPVTVTWYTVQLTAKPTRLPVGKATLLTASAANIPSGYVLDIVNQTTGQVVATGQPGQSVLNYYDTKNTPQTDTYIAQVVQPSNPSIPGLQVPGYVPGHGVLAFTSDAVYSYDSTANQWAYVAPVPNKDGTYNGTVIQQFEPDTYIPPMFDPNNDTVYVWFTYWQHDVNSYYGPFMYVLYGFNLDTAQWIQTSVQGNTIFGMATNLPSGMTFDPQNGMLYITEYEGLYGQQDLYAYNPSTDQQTYVGMGYTEKSWNPSLGRMVFTRIEGPAAPIVYDSNNQTLYSLGANYLFINTEPDKFLYYNASTGATGPVTTVNNQTTYGLWGSSLVYDPNNGWMYFYSSNYYGGGGNSPTIIGYNPATDTAVVYPTGLGAGNFAQSSMVFNPSDGQIYIQLGNGRGPVYKFNPTNGDFTNVGNPAGSDTYPVQLLYDGDLGTILANSYSGQTSEYINGGWYPLATPLGASSLVYIPPHGVPEGTVKNFPYWTFDRLPSYIPTSLFPQQAVTSGEGGGFWVDGKAASKNGTAFFETTFQTSTSQQVTVSIPATADDYEVVYLDGQPVLQNGYSSGSIPSAPGAANGTSTTVTLPAGPHQVVIQGSNTNGFGNPAPNGARVSLQITDQNGQVLVANNANQWMTTGYVTQLPAGWFSGAVGTYNFTEYLMGESGTPVTQQASYTVQTTAQNVALQSQPVSVTWYQYDLTLSASPVSLHVGEATTLTATAPSGAPANAVIQIIKSPNQVIGQSGPGATSYTTTWSEATPTTDDFFAQMIDPSSGSTYAVSNDVQVTWTSIPLTLSDAIVTHTPAWLANLQNYNAYYSAHDPSLVRPVTDFWAGEELVFKVKPSVSTIQQAYVIMSGLRFSPYAPPNPPVNFTGMFTVPLSYDSTTGYLEGHTDPNWSTWFQYLQDGTYTVQFFVKAQDNQVANATAQFAINAPWVSGNDPRTYFHEHEIW
ncbi:hypothetical protein [Alicyclobacillus macrosporangiidus]|uniref:hypothetical protein n=1 Tax=Alicyclobacillus macrosporangiidus TaxID=392015 RepID=UPI0012DCF15C|nr:hypothetical protein [Alicyclobacillus macrosporangiidus]